MNTNESTDWIAVSAIKALADKSGKYKAALKLISELDSSVSVEAAKSLAKETLGEV